MSGYCYFLATEMLLLLLGWISLKRLSAAGSAARFVLPATFVGVVYYKNSAVMFAEIAKARAVVWINFVPTGQHSEHIAARFPFTLVHDLVRLKRDLF